MYFYSIVYQVYVIYVATIFYKIDQSYKVWHFTEVEVHLFRDGGSTPLHNNAIIHSEDSS
jgi:hypothetical protein